jgi:hypothetical protein
VKARSAFPFTRLGSEKLPGCCVKHAGIIRQSQVSNPALASEFSLAIFFVLGFIKSPVSIFPYFSPPSSSITCPLIMSSKLFTFALRPGGSSVAVELVAPPAAPRPGSALPPLTPTASPAGGIAVVSGLEGLAKSTVASELFKAACE